MRIYYRVCEKEETGSGVPRLSGLTKDTIIKKCWLSLQNSIDPNDFIILLEDNISPELHCWLIDNCKCSYSVKQIPTHKPTDYIHFIMVIDAIEVDAKLYPEEIFYLCNDDFLHVPHALTVVKSLYNEAKWPGFVTPYDYPDRYTRDVGISANILLTSQGHWRTIPSDTGVTTARGKTWLRFMDIIKHHVKFNSDQYTWSVYAQTGALCPIPGLSTHLSESNMTPVVDWQRVWDAINIDEE